MISAVPAVDRISAVTILALMFQRRLVL